MARYIYAIEFIERDGEDENVVFSKVIPQITTKKKGKRLTRKELEAKVMESKTHSSLEKETTITGIAWAIDRWFPKHFYHIRPVYWKYDD